MAAAAQGALAAAALLTLTLAPPAHGRTLLVPLNGIAVSQPLLDELMLSRLSPGPLPGSVVVEGRGHLLAAELFDNGIIMLAAPAALCSDDGEGSSR